MIMVVGMVCIYVFINFILLRLFKVLILEVNVEVLLWFYYLGMLVYYNDIC